MLFGVHRRKQLSRVATMLRWRSILLFSLALPPSLHAIEINALNIQSAPGQPFTAQLPIQNAHPDTNLDCFTLEQASTPEPIHLEYTTLGSRQGSLSLWSDKAISTPVTATLTDRCQPSSQTFILQPDNTFAIAPLQTAPQTSPTGLPAVTEGHTETVTTTPDIPADAYIALQQQIDALRQDFEQLQTQSATLYASNLAQADILTTLKNQLIQLQNENHLLRTLVLVLGLALIASGYFLADWLRRHAAAPKAVKNRHKTEQSGKKTAPATVAPIITAPGQTDDFKDAVPSAMPHTQPPYQSTHTANRLQAVPLHANDDEIAINSAPQKTSSQQTTNAVMRDASRLCALGRAHQAIDHLKEHLARHPKCSPWMWLYLLDLLTKEEKWQEFDMVAGECRKHFNLSVERHPDPRQQGIESFPRIMQALQQAWGTPQVISLIDDLVYNTRLVPRMGFERSVFEEMMLLKEIACQTQNLPATPPAAKQVSDSNTANAHLRELQQLSGDIYTLAPANQTPFQYWTDFTFELDEPVTSRKSA